MQHASLHESDYNRPLQGGQLRFYTERWRKLGAPEILIKLISEYRIPFKVKPPLVQVHNLSGRFQTRTSPQMSHVVQTMIKEKVLEIAPETPSFMSKMFLTMKQDGNFRPIFNLKNLNQFVQVSKFRLITMYQLPDFLQPLDWMIKIDLSQAYFHINVAHSHHCFLRLFYDGFLLQMTCLPFGLATAPKVFASTTNWVAQILRQRGYRVIVYLDDYLIVHQDKNVLERQAIETVKLLHYLGWNINFKKSILTPQREIEYLGVLWDTVQNKKFLSNNKIQSMRRKISEILNQKKASLRQLQSLIGLMNFACFVIPQGRLNFRRLLNYSNKLPKDMPDKQFPLVESILPEMQWWLENVQKHSKIHPPTIANFLTTDASDLGWGAEMNGSHISGVWTAQEQPLHCNLKEMLTVLKALLEFAPAMAHSSLLLQSDNQSVVAYLRNQGGTKSTALMELTYEIFQIIEKYNIYLTPYHIPGRYNTLADSLSRQSKTPEWHLLPEATKVIFSKWGTPIIDLFASKYSNIVPKYVTLDQKDKNAVFYNAFSREWNYKLAWIFPPPNLIPKVLIHLNRCRGTFLLVVPKWERAFWRADVKNRAVAPPLKIYNLENRLVDLATGQPPAKVSLLEVWKCGAG